MQTLFVRQLWEKITSSLLKLQRKHRSAVIHRLICHVSAQKKVRRPLIVAQNERLLVYVCNVCNDERIVLTL